MRRLTPILAGLAVLLAIVVLAQLVVRSQTGPLALVSVVEVHLLAIAAVAALLALLGTLGGDSNARWTRLAMLAIIVVAIVRLGGELWSPEAEEARAVGRTGTGTGTGTETGSGEAAPTGVRTGPGEAARMDLRVLTWNLELGSKAAAVTVDGIAASDADLVALQELTPDAATAIEADQRLRARYPYRILAPGAGVDGMGLLSRLPLLVRESSAHPLIMRAGLLLPDGRTAEIFNVHPYPPGIQRTIGLPTGLDTRRRDEDLATIRATVDALEDPGTALVMGDFNAAGTEPGMAVFADGLTDTHAAAGSGPGFTWRPSRIEGLGLGLLRIDHVLAGDWLLPVAASADCSLSGDHCRLDATLRVELATP